MDESIHANIKEKLNFYIANGKIPNIVFHGEPFHGKKTLLNYFIQNLYSDNHEVIKKYVMYVNCAHGKGIKFIRDEVKFFAKTHMHCDEHHLFKSIVFLNADHLTIEAQSALRRCIELYSHSTRFFIVLVDKYKLLKPILSRFCEMYVPEVLEAKPAPSDRRMESLKRLLLQFQQQSKDTPDACDVFGWAEQCYERGFRVLDVLTWLEHTQFLALTPERRYELLFQFHKVKKDFRNEKLFFVFVFDVLFF
jgi:hypothetical protein